MDCLTIKPLKITTFSKLLPLFLHFCMTCFLVCCSHIYFGLAGIFLLFPCSKLSLGLFSVTLRMCPYHLILLLINSCYIIHIFKSHLILQFLTLSACAFPSVLLKMSSQPLLHYKYAFAHITFIEWILQLLLTKSLALRKPTQYRHI